MQDDIHLWEKNLKMSENFAYEEESTLITYRVKVIAKLFVVMGVFCK